MQTLEQQLSVAELVDLTGKTAIVTGGAMGIGRAIAERLQEAGAAVVVADLDAGEAAGVAHELNKRRRGSALAAAVDVSKPAEVERTVAETVVTFGQVDILVNNAGIFPAVPFVDMTESDFRHVLDVNLVGAFLFTKAVAMHMIARGGGGKILNVTSIDALHPSLVGLAHYDASKHGLWGFTKNVALELSAYGIAVNAIAPGGVRTPGVEAMQGGADVDAMAAEVPMHRFAEPDDIARVALFLASDLSSYMTGTQIVADGGWLLT
jgi:2-dehydro-3-deoxy-D-gluconate 5-dehydrogenase